MERRLLDATERLMSEGASFTELSVDRLSTEAGISRASFYIYFEDKAHLLRRLARQVMGDLADDGQRWWGVAWRHNPDDVRTAMAAIIASYRRHQAVLVALNEMAAYDPSVAKTYRDLLTDISRRLTRVIEDGQADGSIRRELPGGHHGQCADLDGRASLPPEPSDETARLRRRAGQHIGRDRLGCTVFEGRLRSTCDERNIDSALTIRVRYEI